MTIPKVKCYEIVAKPKVNCYVTATLIFMNFSIIYINFTKRFLYNISYLVIIPRAECM